ncbi:MAG: hypothetical protein IKW13_00330, partial [Thermoguttaceae bacterium]|nr:hypothetical protein [Thermoguttaceae bacterium]
MSTSAPDPNANRRPSPSAANETVPTPSISAPASPVRYRSFGCPRCRTRLSATKAEVGSVVVCPDCDEKIVVPDYLDFETETDYERFNNPQKRRQDELLSPARNPNRVGIDVAGADIYGVKEKVDATVKNGSGVAGEASSGTASGQNKGESEAVFYPTRCRICETLTQAPAEL